MATTDNFGSLPFCISWMAKLAITALMLKETTPSSWVSAYPSASIKIHHVLFKMRTAACYAGLTVNRLFARFPWILPDHSFNPPMDSFAQPNHGFSIWSPPPKQLEGDKINNICFCAKTEPKSIITQRKARRLFLTTISQILADKRKSLGQRSG